MPLHLALQRRAFLTRGAGGIGSLALASLLRPSLATAAPLPGVLVPPPLPQKAKRVIWLTMAGGPSQLELFDHKPKLAEMDGQPMPESFTKGQQFAQLQGQKLVCLGPQFRFKKYGKSRIEISELLPHIGRVARRHLPRAVDDHGRDQSRSGPHVHEHRLADRRPAEHGLLGRPTASAARRRICRASWCWSPPATGARRSRSPRGSGAAAFCPAELSGRAVPRAGDPVLPQQSGGGDARQQGPT